MAGGNTSTTHISAWVEGDGSGGSSRARLIVSFGGTATRARKSGCDSSGARSLAGCVRAGVEEANGWRQLSEGLYLRSPMRG